jgi:hypothetical protein
VRVVVLGGWGRPLRDHDAVFGGMELVGDLQPLLHLVHAIAHRLGRVLVATE